MTRAKALLSALLLITASPSLAGAVNRPATALDRDDYANVSFNYATFHPKAMKPQPEAENGDGRVFLGADGATLAVYGLNVEGEGGLDADLQPVLDEIAGVGARTT